MAAETTSRRSQEESTSRRTQEETVSRRTQEETSRISLFPLDIFEMDGCIYIYAELPGISKENISIDIYNEKLTIIANKPKNTMNFVSPKFITEDSREQYRYRSVSRNLKPSQENWRMGC